jgi:hypothetical protein
MKKQKFMSLLLIGSLLAQQSSLTALAASEITTGSAFPTDTNIIHHDNVFDIKTNTSVKDGTIGINSFDKFNLDKGDIANLNLIGNQSKLVNLIFDSNASQINGIVNSYMNNSIGGNILFVNPNGFVVGKDGVFNVGSLTLLTPTQDTMQALFDKKSANGVNSSNVEHLISFSFDDNNYLVTGDKDSPFQLDTGIIDIEGKINSGAGINLISGTKVDLKKSSQLNANMDFSENAITHEIIATKKDISLEADSTQNTDSTQDSDNPTSTASNFAMQDGKDIIIVAQNKGKNRDILSAIVNLDGKIDANTSDVIAQSEIYQMSQYEDASVSQVNVNNEISGKNITLKANSEATSADNNILEIANDANWLKWLGSEEINYLISSNLIYLGNLKTQVNIGSNAKLNAIEDVNIGSYASLPISCNSIFEILAFNYTDLDITTEADVSSGASITANNLSVKSTTDLRLTTTSKATNIIERAADMFGKNIMGHGGAYAFNINLIDINNKAAINKDVNLNVKNNIDVIANTVANHNDTTKDGLLPVVDWNTGTVGAAVSIIERNIKNEAIMNANAAIEGALNVVADYTGYIYSMVYGWSTAAGEDGNYGAIGRIVQSVVNRIKGLGNLTENDVIARGTASFSKLQVGAAVAVDIDNVVNNAKIGNSDENIKPQISAKNVSVGAELTDNKSTTYASTETDNGGVCVSGAVAVNIKDLKSNATVYSDMTLSGGDNGNALILLSDTNVIHPMGVVDWLKDFINAYKNLKTPSTQVSKDDIQNVDSGNASDYIANIGDVSSIQDTIDQQGSFSNIMNVVDFNNPVLNGFFNTFASSQANANAKTEKTNAFAGAVSTAVFNTSSNAQLLSDSSITLTGADATKNNIIIQANSNNEMWTGAGLISVLNFTKLLTGMVARDGDSVGGAISFQYSDSDTVAKIGENVKIKTKDEGAVGDLTVEALENGNYVNLAVGSGNADESGLAGGVALTVLNGGNTTASIEKSSEDNSINAKKLSVNSKKDDNFINSVVAYANSQNSKGFGISGIVLYDDVSSYIAGNLNTTDSVYLNAEYDKLFVNSALNVGVAKEGSDAPVGVVSNPAEQEDFYGLALDDLFAEDIAQETENIISRLNAGYDFTRAVNLDKKTSAYAGSITSNVAINSVKAYIADNAKVNSAKDITVNALSSDNMYNASAVISANGKSGGGASVTVDFTKNNVQAYIGENTVVSGYDLTVGAEENFKLIAGALGVAEAKESSGAGNVSIDIQKNDVSSSIRKGSKVKSNKAKVSADVKSSVIKGIGSVSVQAGSSSDAKGAKGATADGDVAINQINAYIDNAEVNTESNLEVQAENESKFITVDIAGAASVSNSAYDGTLGSYISLNKENAYINNSTINSQDTNVNAKTSFNEVAIVGTVAGGDKSSVGGSIRADIIADTAKSYIQNSKVNSKALNLNNENDVNSVAVTVAGSGSTNKNAVSGAVMFVGDFSKQDNYIDNSTINVSSLNLNSNKKTDTIGITGSIAVGLGGASVGESIYTVINSHVMNTFVKNSDVIASNGNIQLNSKYKEDILSIIFGGGGGEGAAVTGAISTLVNNYTMNTYVLADNNQKLYSNNGDVKVSSDADVNTITIDGNVGVSTSSAAVGGAVNSTVYNSTINAGIEGADVQTKGNVDVLAKAVQKHVSTAVGASIGSSAGVEGSVETVVINQDINSYIKKSKVKSEGNVSVNANDNLDYRSGIGAVAGSTSGAAVGGTIGTFVVNKNINSEILNSELSVIGNIENNSIVDFYLLSTMLGFGGASEAAINGTVGTQVFNTKAKSEIEKSTLTLNGELNNKSSVSTDVQTYIASANGAGSAAIGGVVYSIVDNSTANALINSETIINNASKFVNNANSTSNYVATMLNASGSGEAAVNGNVSTFVLNSGANSVITGLTANNIGDTDVASVNNSKTQIIMLEASGSGEVAVNGGVNTIVSSKKSKAEINNSTIKSTGNIKVKSDANNELALTVVGGAASGEAAITGAVNTIVSSDKIEANIKNSNISTSIANNDANDNGITVKSNDKLNITGRTFSLAGSGGVAVGGAIVTGVVTNSVNSLVEQSDLTADNSNIIIGSIANETIGSSSNPFITLVATGSGGVSVSGAVDTLVLNSSSKSQVIGKKDKGLIADNNIGINSESNTTLFLTSGSAAGGQTGIGGTVSTIVVNKTNQALAKNTILSANSLNIKASENDDFTNVIVAGSVASSVGISGLVTTNVISSTINSGIENSIINVNKTSVNSNSQASFGNIAGEVSASLTVGLGASVLTNVVGYNTSSYIENSSLKDKNGISSATSVDVNANALTNYDVYATSGGVGGSVSVVGVVETNFVKNSVKSYVTGAEDKINTNKLQVSSKDIVNFEGIAGTLSASLEVGVGATVQINSVKSNVISYLGGNINAGDIDVIANGEQNFKDLILVGFSGGAVAVNGSSLTNIVETTADIISTQDLDVTADNTTTITEKIGTGAIAKYAAVGASVGVNKVANTIETYTGNNVKLNAVTSDFQATSTTNIGKSDNNIEVASGSVAIAGIAGSILVNNVNNTTNSYIGTNNQINSTKDLKLKAEANTNIYESLGSIPLGLVSAGATVGVNNINNTVNSYIGANSVLKLGNGSLTINALSKEIVNANGNVIGIGGIALNGGVLYTTIGKNVDNANENELSDGSESYDAAIKQSNDILNDAETKQNTANTNFVDSYNQAIDDSSLAVNTASSNINNSLEDADVQTKITISANTLEQKNEDYNLFNQTNNTKNTQNSTDRQDTISAYIDTNVDITANGISVYAKNENDLATKLNGKAYGLAGVGVSVGVADVNTTINSFVSNDVKIQSNNNIEIKAESKDKNDINVEAAAGGVVSGSGTLAKANSNKITNTYILSNTTLTAKNDIDIQAVSDSFINTKVYGETISGVSVGASEADSVIGGETNVNLGENISILSEEGNTNIGIDKKDEAIANADALSGSLVGGIGAEANAITTRKSNINIGKNANIISKLVTKIKETITNKVDAETNGRAYGVVSAGGTKTTATISNTSGINIADADKDNKVISGSSVEINSNVINTTSGSTKAGAGAIALSVGGSGVYTNIQENNKVYVGKNYKIMTTNGEYIVAANANNTYKAYNDSSAYGIVGVTAGIIENNVNSTVETTSNADVEANGAIELVAMNTITKKAVENYDIYGGAGGVAGVGAASLTDTIVANTNAFFGGNEALATGKNDNGYITISANTKLDINEKSDVTAGGVIPVADGNVSVKSNVSTKTEISNKNIKTADDDIEFLATNAINIYTKSNVESYGGLAVADGKSIADNNSAVSSVIINSGTNALSARDTYVQAVCDKTIQSYMYAKTEGLIGVVGNSKAVSSNNSVANIIIEKDVNLKSYDSMNVCAVDSVTNLSATRDAKGTTYLLFAPITIYGKGNETKIDSTNSTITLDGNLESGLGANRSLVVNKDNSYTSTGINVIGQEKVGTVSSSDIDIDRQAYKLAQEGELAEVDDYIAIEQQKITNAENLIIGYNNSIDNLNKENNTYSETKTLVNSIIDNNNEISKIDNITSEWAKAYQSSTDNDGQISYTVNANFGTVLDNNESSNSAISSVKSAYATYQTDSSFDNLQNLVSAINGLSSAKSEIQSDSDTKSASIQNVNIDFSNNEQLNSYISAIDNSIATNNKTIANTQSSIKSSQGVINDANTQIAIAEQSKDEINSKYTAIYDDLDKQSAQANTTGIDVYSLMIDNIYVRSGETNIMGKMTGNGSITAPGNKFSINIINNSVSDIVYQNIQIERGVSGSINGLQIADTINKTLKNTSSSKDISISILNTVDRNDPTINVKNGYGDMVFTGNISNTNGLVSLVNNTGSILSAGSITAKDLTISVPNGDYTQSYTTDSTPTESCTILAAGDINIASKTIDINGTIQSGTEYKSVTIPSFTVVKSGDTYYQVVNGQKVQMNAGSTDGYYYINLNGNGETDSSLELIKAYFKPTDTSDLNNIKGDIYLFNSQISGGNITLTGNIVSSNNSGKIVLINGYGHIDVVNNSNYNLVTNALDVDNRVSGKLTINDFKFESDKSGSKYDNVTQKDIENADWIAKNTDTFTATADSNGNITTTTGSGISTNGYFLNDSKTTTNADGLMVSTTTYKPGTDAFVLTQNASTETKYRIEYVKRSWWTEFWHGKEYRRVYYTISHDPVYSVQNNNVLVQFQGYTTPTVNITSVGSVVMNNSLNALNGTVNITSSAGSILTNDISNIINATNINLSAKGDIGNSSKAIQTAVYNNGLLTAKGNNIYIDYPSSDISNIILNAQNTISLSTSSSQLGGLNSLVNISADILELKATKGSIDLDSTQNKNIDISVKKLKARANGNISITNKNDLQISSIVSTSKGTITLGSENGSIIAVDTDSYNPYHLTGGNIILKASNGYIATSSNPLKVAYDGIYNVVAKKDINIDSAGRIYADLIQSELGKVTLDADYGIIASTSSNNLVYNIYSANGVDLSTLYGNIENISINTDGIINATAGYTNGVASGMSDISLSLISKKELEQDDIQNMTDEQLQIAYNEYINGLKDMQLGEIKASKNVFIHSEKSINVANENSSITAETIVLSAINGNIGSEDNSLTVDSSRDISAYAGNESSVYLNSNSNLNINEIRSAVGSNGTASSKLSNVVLTTTGNIINAAIDENKVNVSANNITLSATGDIGTLIKSFVVNTNSEKSTDGLIYNANNVYIDSLNDNLNILSANTVNNSSLKSSGSITIDYANIGQNASITTTGKTTIGNAEVGGAFTNTSKDTEITGKLIVNNGLTTINADNSIAIEDGEFKEFKASSLTANIVKATVAEDLEVTTTGKTTIGSAEVGGAFTNTSKDTEITGKLTVNNGLTTINADNSIAIEDGEFKEFKASSLTANIVKATVAEDLDVTTTGKTTIGNAEVGGAFTNTSKDTEITGKLTVNNGLTTINADNSIAIEDGEFKEFKASSLTANIVKATVTEDLDVTTTGKTTIGNAEVGGAFTNTSKDTEITGKLTVNNGLTTINAIDNINIANADIGNDLDMIANDIQISEINLVGNMNAKVDKLSINSSHNIQIGTIVGNINDYISVATISSNESILNGIDDKATNLVAKEIKLEAGKSIGNSGTPIVAEVVNQNNIIVSAKDSIYIISKGADSNYSKIETGDISLSTDKALKINDLIAQNAEITTKANELSINNILIGETGTLRTANKYVAINNIDLTPILNADIQMYITRTPAEIIIDGTNNIRTSSINVTRQNGHIKVNEDLKYQSMNNTITSLNESSLKNTNVSENTIEKTETLIYSIPTHNAYQASIVQNSVDSLVKTNLEENIIPSNAHSIINVIGNNENVKPDNITQKTMKNDKVSTKKDTKINKVSSL